MRVRVLGPLEVDVDGATVDIGGARLRTLLTRLALDAGRTVGTESLAYALWHDDPPGDRAKALQSLVSRLRQALPERALLRSAPNGYCLDVPADAVDALRFERLAREGRRALPHDVHAAHRGAARVRAQQRGEDADGGGLARAVGPSTPRIVPGRAARVIPASAVVVANRLLRPSASNA